jgi:hypothetical protein
LLLSSSRRAFFQPGEVEWESLFGALYCADVSRGFRDSAPDEVSENALCGESRQNILSGRNPSLCAFRA